MQGVQSVVVGRGGGWCAESDTTEARGGRRSLALVQRLPNNVAEGLFLTFS